MKKKRILIILFAMILAFAIAGCDDKNKVDKEVSGDVSENEYVTENESVLENETVTENEKVAEETQKTDNKKDNTTTNTETNKNNTTTNKNESISNKNETTGNNNTTTKPSTGSTGNTGSTNNSGNTGSTTNNNTNSGTTTQPSTPVHEHNWVEVTEEVKHYYDWRTICGKCKADLTDMTSDDRILHVGMVCGGRYSVELVEVDYVTENVQTETVVVGHKCSCGATK